MKRLRLVRGLGWMTRYALAASALLLASAGSASADYVIIVANIGAGKELRAAGGGMQMGGIQMGMGGMQMGMRGGMQMGMGGMQMGGMQMGMRGGMQMGGMQMGMRGGMQMGGMQMGMRGGMQMGGMQMGMRGGPQPGMGGMQMGMRGGPQPPMPGGTRAGTSPPIDVDDLPDFILAVVEVKTKSEKFDLSKQWSKTPGKSVPVSLNTSTGKSCLLLKNPSFGETFVITEGKDNPIATVHDRFTKKLAETMKEKPTVRDLLSLAEWALKHGLVDEFAKVMDKLVEIDKSHPSAVAYLKVKAELARKAADEDSIASWRGKLLDGYKVNGASPHYLIVHNSSDTAPEMLTHQAHLEYSFRGFYYWFALKGIALTVPARRQVVVLTKSDKDFLRLHGILSAAPQVVDGFFARRENLAVMTADCQDDSYDALKKYWKNQEAKGFNRLELLMGKARGGKWHGVPAKYQQPPLQPAAEQQIAEAQMLALMLKTLEQQAELATVSHDASRQLLFASGLLPRNVVVPEWILFGMGSLFETPLQSPWPIIGAPSPYYLPRWRDLDVNKPASKPKNAETLRKLVTDFYFRGLPPPGEAESAARRLHDAAVRKARTLAWSLTYYLAQENLDGLRRYFSELSKMPRDLELDEAALLGCFARAFGCVDRDNKVIDAKLEALEMSWISYMQHVKFDSEQTMREIRKKIEEHEANARKREQEQNNAGQQGQPLRPGGAPGVLPPAGGVPRPQQ